MTTNNNIVQNLSSPHGGTKRGASYFKLSELTRSTTAEACGIDNTPSVGAVPLMVELIDKVLDPLRLQILTCPRSARFTVAEVTRERRDAHSSATLYLPQR